MQTAIFVNRQSYIRQNNDNLGLEHVVINELKHAVVTPGYIIWLQLSVVIAVAFMMLVAIM